MAVLVATPGRLLQHLDEAVDFETSNLKVLVLDEADRILDMGFKDQVTALVEQLSANEERQTLLFSATLRPSVKQLAGLALKQPQVVSVLPAGGKKDENDKENENNEAGVHRGLSTNLQQHYITVPLERKLQVLFSFLRAFAQEKIVVFFSSQKQVRFVYEAFKRIKTGGQLLEFHGKQSLQKRLVVLESFKEIEKKVCMLCTDVAARGIDIPEVDWVIQFDCPDTLDTYVHR